MISADIGSISPIRLKLLILMTDIADIETINHWPMPISVLRF